MKNKNGYFISVGGGKNQLPLIQKAKERGAHVLTIDKNDMAPGFEHSQVKIIESTHEYRKVLSALSQVPMTEPVIGIGCRSYGKATYTTAYLAEKLKIPSSKPAFVRTFLNKKDYLEKFDRLGINIPKIYTWSSKSQILKSMMDWNYPLILKPVDGSGKRGIEIFRNPQELKSGIEKKYPDPEKYFIQEFIDGDEITALGIVDSQDFHLLLASDKITTEYPPFIEVAHTVPTKHPDYLSEMTVIMNSIAKKFQLKYTPLLAEFKIHSDGTLYLIESVPEIGGEYLADFLFKEYFGIDYFDILYDLLTDQLDRSLIPSDHILNKKSAILFSVPPEKNSIIDKIENFIPKLGEKVFLEKNLLEPGKKISSVNGNSDRTKVIGLTIDSPQDMNRWVKDVLERMRVEYK